MTRKNKQVVSKAKLSEPKSSESDQTSLESNSIFDNVDINQTFSELKLPFRLRGLLTLLEIGAITQEDIKDGSYKEKVNEFIKNKHIAITIDHTDEILDIARTQRDKKQWNEALLHYAIFIEHKINGMIVRLGQKTKAPADAVKGLVRELRLELKATWVLELLGGQPFDKETVNKMKHIAEVRNAYVHYKWNEHNDQAKSKLEKAIDAAEEVVVSIVHHEDANLFQGKRQDLIKLLSKNIQSEKKELIRGLSEVTQIEKAIDAAEIRASKVHQKDAVLLEGTHQELMMLSKNIQAIKQELIEAIRMRFEDIEVDKLKDQAVKL